MMRLSPSALRLLALGLLALSAQVTANDAATARPRSAGGRKLLQQSGSGSESMSMSGSAAGAPPSPPGSGAAPAPAPPGADGSGGADGSYVVVETPMPASKVFCYDYVLNAGYADGTPGYGSDGMAMVGTSSMAGTMLKMFPDGSQFAYPEFGMMNATCDYRATGCVTVVVFNEQYPQGIIFPSCYQPDVIWTDSMMMTYDYSWQMQWGVKCEEKEEGMMHWNEDRTILYSCCSGPGCNKVNNETFLDVKPKCGMDSSYETMMCLDQYSIFGCSASLVHAGGVRLPPNDACFHAMLPNTGCFKSFCEDCNCSKRYPEEMGMERPKHCKLMCGEIEAYPSNGCHRDMIGDGNCDLFCMTKDGFYDGGDCLLSEEFGTFVDRGTEDFEDEYNEAIEGSNGNRFDPEGKISQGMPTATLVQDQALLLFSLLDTDFNQELDYHEMNIKHEDFEMVDGDDDNDTVDAVELYRFFLNVVDTLTGKPVPEGVNMRYKIMIAVSIAARSDTHLALTDTDAMLLGIDEYAFKAIDVNEDHHIDPDEIWELGKMVIESGCNGFRQVWMKEGEFEFFASPIRAPDSSCKILVLPDFFYKPMGLGEMYGDMPGPWGPLESGGEGGGSDEGDGEGGGGGGGGGSGSFDPVPGPQTTAARRRRLLSVTTPIIGTTAAPAPPAAGGPGGTNGGPDETDGGPSTTAAPLVATPQDLSEKKQWMATIMSDKTRDVKCYGALISSMAVLTAASCVADEMPDSIFVRVGGTTQRSGLEIEVKTVSVHPGFQTMDHVIGGHTKMVSMYDVAILILKDPAMGLTPVMLYDGMDIGVTDCKELVMEIGAYSENVEHLMKMDNHECDEMFELVAGYPGIVQPDHVCVQELPMHMRPEEEDPDQSGTGGDNTNNGGQQGGGSGDSDYFATTPAPTGNGPAGPPGSMDSGSGSGSGRRRLLSQSGSGSMSGSADAQDSGAGPNPSATGGGSTADGDNSGGGTGGGSGGNVVTGTGAADADAAEQPPMGVEGPMWNVYPGAPLVAKADGDREMWKLVGLAMTSGQYPALIAGEGEHDMDTFLYTRTASFLPWIYAHDLTTMGALKPDQKLSLEIKELELEEGAMLNVSMGPSVGMMSESVEMCDIPSEQMNMGGTLVLEAKLPYMKSKFSIEAEVSVKGCGVEMKADDGYYGEGGGENLVEGGGLRRRRLLQQNADGTNQEEDSYSDDEPMCEPCTLFDNLDRPDHKWKAVRKLVKLGSAFTGGLGSKAVSDFWHEYGVWVCAKDWMVEEQLACGAGPGELFCFRFDEKSQRFDEYGYNKHVNLVPKEKEEMGDYKATHYIHPF